MIDENNKCQPVEDTIKNSNPLSVRVDPYYKDVFEELIKKKNVPKKTLLEAMIASYVDNGLEGERESNISFASEINLIADNFNEIIKVFKTMAIKSQDTIGSQKSFYEQKNRNADTAIQILEDKIAILEEKNKSLEIENDSNKANREKLKKAIRELSESGNSSEKEISGYIRKNAELLEKINVLQKEEKDSMILRADFDTTKDELKMLRSSIKDKNYENEKLSKKIKDLEESMIEAKTKRADEFKELELLIKKELEVDKKMEMLRMQLQFNELQSENLKNLGVINKQSEEIAELKSKLKK